MNAMTTWLIEKLVDKRRVAAILLMGINALLVIAKQSLNIEIPAEFAVQLSTLLAGIAFALWSKLASMKAAADKAQPVPVPAPPTP